VLDWRAAIVLATRKNLLMHNQSRVESTANLRGQGADFPAHRIGILMSQTGRFLECIQCRRTFAFPPGERYDVVAKQFEGHRCEPAVTPADVGS
jgi:hypothetical protein